MREIVVQESSLGVTDVEIAPSNGQLIGFEYAIRAQRQHLRRLWRESGHNALFGIQKRDVIAAALPGLGGLLLPGGSAQGLDYGSGPRAQLLHEVVPTRQVEQRPFLDRADCYAVAAQSTPDGNIGSGERISDNEGTEGEVLVEALQVRLECLEVEGSERIQLRQPGVLLEKLLDELNSAHAIS